VLVVDASVIVKWLLNSPQAEPATGLATQLMQSVASGQTMILQPAHWLIEVAAVLARLSPDTAAEDIAMLRKMELATTDEPEVLRRACELAIDLRQHVFDTMHHAVALEAHDAVLITADERYLRAARRIGRIMALTEWRP
jgi:predicted nucleic acid-binding protein